MWVVWVRSRLRCCLKQWWQGLAEARYASPKPSLSATSRDGQEAELYLQGQFGNNGVVEIPACICLRYVVGLTWGGRCLGVLRKSAPRLFTLPRSGRVGLIGPGRVCASRSQINAGAHGVPHSAAAASDLREGEVNVLVAFHATRARVQQRRGRVGRQRAVS